MTDDQEEDVVITFQGVEIRWDPKLWEPGDEVPLYMAPIYRTKEYDKI